MILLLYAVVGKWIFTIVAAPNMQHIDYVILAFGGSFFFLTIESIVRM